MSDENVVLAVAVAVLIAAMLLLGQFAYWSLTARQEENQQELARRIGSVSDKVMAPLIRFGAASANGGFAGHLDETLRSAGSPYPIEILYRNMLISGLVGVGFLLFAWKGPAAVIGVGAAYLPVLVLARQADARLARLTEQLPDGLDLLARSLQAGHGVGESLRLVAEEMAEPLASEFGRVFEEQNLGRDTRECFQNLCRRNPRSFDLRIFVSSVLLQRDTGGNLVEILQGIANTIRERFVFQGKVGALTSEARFTAYILGGLPFAIGTMIYFMSPGYIDPLFSDPLGKLLVFGGAIWFVSGIVFMRELAKVEI
ncbi:hypothetical protein LBMAG42_24000 [Deltaproteobacteria bacterium]|nr:hypothetical protein LBMAG42_24000 [Deltaproteobacteria bacterium]